jgi:hypothetical protein
MKEGRKEGRKECTHVIIHREGKKEGVEVPRHCRQAGMEGVEVLQAMQII